MESNNNATFREEKKRGMGWIWWLIGLLILLGLLWLLFGQGLANRNTNNGNEVITDNVSNRPTGDLPSDTEFDANGLPILGPNAPIANVRVETAESFPVQATLVVAGDLPDGCTYLNSPSQIRQGNTFFVNLSTRIEGDVCTEALVPYERRIPLDVNELPAGAYIININGQEVSFELTQDNILDFQSGSDK